MKRPTLACLLLLSSACEAPQRPPAVVLPPQTIHDDAGRPTGERFLVEKPKFALRHGIVRLAGRTLIDDDGPFLGVGASCMWCLWGFEHDRPKVDANLACIAGISTDLGCPKHGADFVRVFGVVGPGGGWSDRAVDARSPTFDAAIAGFTDYAYDRFGLRVQWTIFAGIDSTPTPSDRAALVDRFIAMSRGREWKIIYWEVANEGPLNGFGGDAGKGELKRLGARLRSETPIIVALTSPQGEPDPDSWYADSRANLRTVHLDRDVKGTGGMFRPLLQARDMVDQPLAWASNEPIGIDSSVAADSDPTRLTLSAIYTWLCHGAAYVIHTGAGIRGGGAADLARGRVADVWRQPTFAATIEALTVARAALPADLPNFPRWENGNDSFPGYPFNVDPIKDEANVLRAFCAIAPDARFVCVPIDVKRPTPFIARVPLSFDAIEPMSGRRIAHADLEPGQVYTQPAAPGMLFVGSLR